MNENVTEAWKYWATSLHSPQFGVTPLSSPAAFFEFPFVEESLTSTYQLLRTGGDFDLAPQGKLAKELGAIARPTQWLWLRENLTESTELQVALGFISQQDQRWAFPLFTGTLSAASGSSETFLRLDEGFKLNLNTTLVKILAKKYGVNPAWTRAGRTSSGFDLDKLWQALEQALHQTPRARGLELEKRGRAGLAHRDWDDVYSDLEKHLVDYGEAPLVNRYATKGEPVGYPPTKHATLSLSQDIYAPLKASHLQLRVPQAFGRGESFILSGPPAAGKTDAVVNSLAQGIVAGKTVLVVGGPASLRRLKTRINKADFGHLFLALDPHHPDATAQSALKSAWDEPVSADDDYLKSCRQSLTMLSEDLDVYAKSIHEPGPNGVSAWQAYSATLLTKSALNREEQDLATELATLPRFPATSKDRAQAAKLGQVLATLDSHSVNGLGANPWSLVGTKARTVDKTALTQAVTALETAIKHTHPAVLEIMSAAAELETWPWFSRWLDLLEIGYGREPVELTEKERVLVTGNLKTLKSDYSDLLGEANPLLKWAGEAYRRGLDQQLISDARHAEASKGLTRTTRRKALLKELQPHLSKTINPAEVAQTLEALASLRQRSLQLSSRISANPMLGLPKFDALAKGAHDKFLYHADTILTAVEMAALLPSRVDDLVSLIPIAREGGSLGRQVRDIAGAFASILEELQTEPAQLEFWSHSLPPLARYLQIRKQWASALPAPESTLDDMVAFRNLQPKLAALGLEPLSDWVSEGKLSGKSISGVLEYALSLASLTERQHALERQSFSSPDLSAQTERLTATAAETRREISNVVKATAANYATGLSKEDLREFGARLRDPHFSIQKTLGEELHGVLARTPLLGLTPSEVATHLPPATGTPLFDALVILDSADLPCGAAVKALSLAKQVLFVATTPSAKAFARGKSPSVYAAARGAGFPEMRFDLRYGSDLSPVTALTAAIFGGGEIRTWPVSWHPASATVLPLDPPSSPAFSLSPADELPGWKGTGANRAWFEKAGNFLINLALKNKNSTIHAITLTGELAAGIRWYLGDIAQSRELGFPQVTVSSLGDFEAQESSAVVFFLGGISHPLKSKSPQVEDFLQAFSRALLGASHRLWLVEDKGFDRLALPAQVQDFLSAIETPGRAEAAPEGSNYVVEHLKKRLTKSGLEVHGPLGVNPLVVDLAVRGGADAPWMGIVLDTPSRCGITPALDREVTLPNYLVEQCGFGQIEHIYFDQLVGDEDEVVRRLVSLSLDLAFPGEVTEGAVASEDRYSSPTRVLAAQSQRIDSWDLPTDSGANWSLPASLRPAGTPLSPPTPLAPSAPATPATASAPSTPHTPPTSATSPVVEPIPSAVPDTEISLGKGLNTSSPLPLVSEVPPTSFTHLSRQELVGMPLPEPSLSDHLGENETEWITNLTALPETGKISQPGAGAFAPLVIPSREPREAPSATVPAIPANIPAVAPETALVTPAAVPVSVSPKASQTVATPVAVPAPAPAPAGATPPNELKTEIQPFVPRGKPLTDLGDKEILDDLDEPDNAAQVSEALEKILYSEGPIATSRLAKLAADAFGMQRLHPKRREKILALLSPEVNICSTKFGDFAWPKGTSPENFHVFRTGSIYGQRALTDISDEEFNNALTWVIATQRPLEEEASEAVARVLDLTAARTSIRQRMAAALTLLAKEGHLERKDGRFHLQ